MIVVITRDVTPRFRGFLASCMLEIGPGVYTQPKMSRGVRERIWSVLSDWYAEIGRGSIIMTWKNVEETGLQEILTLGVPPVKICSDHGVHLTYR